MINPEARIKSALPIAMQKNTEVDLKYSSILKIINHNLRSIYGNRANWADCVEEYNCSTEYKDSCREATSINNIPLISTDKIFQMLEEEESAKARIRELLDLREPIQDASNKEMAMPETLRAAELLGVLPALSTDSLNRWFVNRREMSEDVICQMDKFARKNSGTLRVIVSSMMDAYQPGMIYRYPIAGIIITQPKCLNYYRGENAFYGSSKAGLFRRLDRTLPEVVAKTVALLRQNEGCAFLDNLDAVRQWNISDVNYLALAQHYGLATAMMDLTSDLRTALFFACCQYGQDMKWHPLKKKDIAKADSRQNIAMLGGDSRYGIIYQMPAEINDMRLMDFPDNEMKEIVIPVGYQPFMRCSNQFGYMWVTSEESPDLLTDKRFSKVKFRITEELTNWIYNEMDQGNKIYPNSDIPEISDCMSKINRTKIFSRSNFDTMLSEWNMDQKEKKTIEKILLQYGYTISNGEVEYIATDRLASINQEYTAQKAFDKLNISPCERPVFSMFG